jgi:hypothetical protein
MFMRPSSLRALLLALAMVFQAIAAGTGVARAAPSLFEATFSEHCEKTLGNAEPADTRHGLGHHGCEACCLCAGPPTASVTQDIPTVISPRAVRSIGFLSERTIGAPVQIARAQFARGPPRPF